MLIDERTSRPSLLARPSVALIADCIAGNPDSGYHCSFSIDKISAINVNTWNCREISRESTKAAGGDGDRMARRL